MSTARIYTNDFNRIISATKGFCAPPSAAATMEFAKFIKLEFDAESSIVTAVAIDGYRLSVEHAVISDCDENFSVYIRPSVKLPNKENATISLANDEVIIRCNEFMYGYKQPEIKTSFDLNKYVPPEKPAFRIGFDANLLLTALQAAKASCGGGFKNPLAFEFKSPLSPLSPVIIRTGSDDIKLVMPIRLKD